jgi:hypothetical protein
MSLKHVPAFRSPRDVPHRRPGRLPISRDVRELIVRLRDIVADLDEDFLFTPGALPWSHGRALWASVLVRRVWHPSGHLHRYLAEHGRPDRAREMQQHLYALAVDSGIPNRPGGLPFAAYNLACALALSGDEGGSRRFLAEAVASDSNLARYTTSRP